MQEHKNNTFLKLFYSARNFIELYLPIGIFTIMFMVFILQVFFRYLVNHPLTWTQDVIVISFCWIVPLGAAYTMRKHGHVMFTMVYDEVKPKTAAFLRLLGNLIIIATYCMLIIPSYKYCHFVAFQKTATLRLSYYWIFLPFVYFIIAVIGYTIPEVLEDIRILRGKQKDSIVHEQSLLKEVKL